MLKRAGISVVALVFGVSLALGAAEAVAQDWANEMFATLKHDFGNVARGAKTEFAFELENIYLEDVHIAGVRSSCGCTQPTITKPLLKTYERGSIVAALNTRSFLGQKSATITVTIDKPFPAEVQLQVSGYIRSDIVLTPGSLELGTVDQGEALTKTINIAYAGRNDWRIVGLKPSSPHLQASLAETNRGGGQVGYSLNVRLDPETPVGYLRDEIVVETNDPGNSQFVVEVSGRVLSEVTVTPSSLFLGVLQPGQVVTKQLVVRSKRPFRVTEIQCADEAFKFETTDSARPIHVIPVTFTAPTQPGKITQQIDIATDLGPGVLPQVQAFAQVLESTTPSPAEGR